MNISIKDKTMVNLSLFHDEIKKAIRKNAIYAKKEITENDIESLLDPFVSRLLWGLNRCIVLNNESFSSINCFYDKTDVIELFDDLFISFGVFLDERNVSIDNCLVYRVDNFTTFFLRTSHEDYQKLLGKYTLIPFDF